MWSSRSCWRTEADRPKRKKLSRRNLADCRRGCHRSATSGKGMPKSKTTPRPRSRYQKTQKTMRWLYRCFLHGRHYSRMAFDFVAQCARCNLPYTAQFCLLLSFELTFFSSLFFLILYSVCGYSVYVIPCCLQKDWIELNWNGNGGNRWWKRNLTCTRVHACSLLLLQECVDRSYWMHSVTSSLTSMSSDRTAICKQGSQHYRQAHAR